MSVISVQELTKAFGPVLAVDRLSFELRAGAVVGFLGPNGAGKTTTLRMLLGLVTPTAGRATVLGVPYRELSRPVTRVGAMLEASGAHPSRRAVEHLRILATAAGLPLSRVEEVLGQVGLADAASRRVGGFSLGMRQRLGLAAALLGDPEVLILDEPANGLDPEGVRWLRALLRSLAGEGRTVLLSSHLLAEAAQAVDEVVVVNRGRLVAHTPLAEFVADLDGSVRVRTPEADALQALLGARGIAAELVGPGQLVATGTSAEAVGTAAAEGGIPVFELNAEHPRLEDAFLAAVREGRNDEQPVGR